MKLLKAIEYAIRNGASPAESASEALEELLARVPEFEYLELLLPDGVKVNAGLKPAQVKSAFSVSSPGGIVIRARSQARILGSLHKLTLEKIALLLQKALRSRLKPGGATAALHGGGAPFTLRKPAVTPIYQTTAFEFESLAQLEEFLADQDKGYIYSRWGNPTVTEAQDRLAALTGTEAALLFSSGMGAISTSLLTLLGSGDRLVALRHLYGGTVSFLNKILPRFGITVELVGFEDIRHLKKKLKGAKAFYFESISNPTLRVPDVKAIVNDSKSAGVISVCDNTFATPYNLRTVEHGVDLEIHSGSKFLSGHSDLIIGAACGSKELISKVNLTMRYMGTNAGPFEAFLLSRGLRTLPVRMERHNANALSLAGRLQEIPGVKRVLYPHFKSHPDHTNAGLLAGGGGMVTFEVEGGLEAVRRVAGRMKLVRSLTTLGSPETSFCVPVLSSHYGLPPEVLAEAQVTEGMIRVSVGLEDVLDIIEDFEQALAIAK